MRSYWLKQRNWIKPIIILYSRNNAELKQMSKLQKAFLPITTVFNPRTYRDIKKLIREAMGKAGIMIAFEGTDDVPDYAVVGGVPAKVIRYRNVCVGK